MSKKLILVLGLVFFFLGANLAKADVIINEIQINPTEGRFIELYNGNSSEVDLTDWYIQRKTATGSDFGSLVSKTYFENKTIEAGGYFLISKNTIENADIVLGSLTLTESNTIQLKNGNQEVVDKVGWGSGESSVGDNPAEGQSIQKTESGSWISSIPTPGTANETNAIPSPTSSTDANSVSSLTSSTSSSSSISSSSTNTTEIKTKAIENPTMKVKILTGTLAFTGQPFEIQTSVTGFLNEKVVLGKAYWNFGDGSSFEQINNFEKFSHIYYYPGEYILFLEYYRNNFSKVPEATTKTTIKVLPTTVSISKVGDAKDFFIELSNNASSDMDISNWVIKASGKVFILPKNSIIMSKKQMTISSKITGFSYGDQFNLKLYSGTDELIFDYSSSLVLAKTHRMASSTLSSIPPIDEGETPKVERLFSDVTQASAISSGVMDSNINNSYLPILGSIIFIGASASAVYFIRRKKISREEANDFEILDE
ncbi:MAG: lamin tail domain-containing protein [Candidatus Paceibacterota bacterium]